MYHPDEGKQCVAGRNDNVSLSAFTLIQITHKNGIINGVGLGIKQTVEIYPFLKENYDVTESLSLLNKSICQVMWHVQKGIFISPHSILSGRLLPRINF